MLLIMLLHPSGRDLFVPGQAESAARMAFLVHSIALLSMPVSFLGALALSRRLASPDRIAVGGIVMYGFAMAAGMMAAVASGLVAPSLAQRAMTAEGPASEMWRAGFQQSGLVNQAFARVLVVAAAAAIVLWSLAIVRGRALGAGLGYYGLLLGAVLILAMAIGRPGLDVHSFGLVMLGQSSWFIAAGILMWRSAARNAGAQPPNNST